MRGPTTALSRSSSAAVYPCRVPFVLCSVCGCSSHLRVPDQKAWYEERCPGVPFGALVPGRCLDCWPALAKGDAVVTRDTLKSCPIAQDQRGVVTDVWARDDEGQLFVVTLEDGKTATLLRAQLRRRRQHE